MSIKKLAKSINNLADAIRYHADGGATSASMTRSPLPGGFKAPKYEGKESPTSTPLGLAAESVRNSFVKIYKPIAGGAPPPAPLTEAEENFVDPYDAPPKADYTIVTPQPPAIIAPDADITISAEKSDLAPPSVDAPSWQTLTVEELDAAPPSVEVDADGLPWDERIHSGGKTLLVDGTWRLKRGVPDDEYQGVVAELKKLMAIPAPVDNTPPPPPSASVPTPPPPSATVDNLPAFIKAVTGAQLDKDVVLAAVKNAGLENVMQLGARPDLIAGIAKELGL